MNFRSYFEKLEQDVLLLVKSKIKDIKSVEEFDSILTFRFYILFDYDLKKLYLKLNQFKSLLQVLLNSFHNFEKYKNLYCSFTVDNSDECEKWKSFCEFDVNKRHWKCVKRPSEEALGELVFKYLLYLTSVRRKEGYNAPDVSDTRVDNTVGLMKVKDAVNNKEPIQDKDSEDTTGDEDTVELPSPSIRKIDNHGRVGNCYSQEKVKDAVNNKEPIQDKWICGKCECFNDYPSMICNACTEVIGEGFWICGSCTMRNSCQRSVCYVCGTGNDHIKEEEKVGAISLDYHVNDNQHRDEPLGVDVTVEGWSCMKCGIGYSYSDNACGRCKINRNQSGKWRCRKCGYDNKCKDDKCESCDKVNDRLGKGKGKAETNEDGKKMKQKYESLIIKDKWKCQFLNCGYMNEDKDPYCHNCRLDRNLSQIVGAEIKMKTTKGIVEGWVCHGCNKFNDLSKKSCIGKKCNIKRYDDIVCIACRATSNERRKNCDKCGQEF